MTKFSPYYALLLCLVFFQLVVQSTFLKRHPAVAHDLHCQELEEFFGFNLKSYAVEHQGNVTVDIDVVYRLIASPEITHHDYPDFLPILRDIQDFIVDYPNETDYWEVLNRNLVEYLLDKYQQLATVTIDITVLLEESIPFKPVSYENYERSSIVTVTRPGFCSTDE